MKKSILLIALALLTLSGCENKSSTTSGVGIDITGNWTGSLFSKVIITELGLISAALTKTADGVGGSKISGVMSITATLLKCYTGGTIDSDKSTLTGDSITLTVSDANGATITFTGTVTASTMSGVYTAKDLPDPDKPTIGAGNCKGAPEKSDTGTWTLTKVSG